MERRNCIPETDEDSSSGDESSRRLIDPRSHLVKKQVGGNTVKVVVIYSNGEQTLFTIKVYNDLALQDLLNEMTRTHKIIFSEETKCYLETNPELEYNYIVYMGDESCLRTGEDGVDSDGHASMIFNLRKRHRARTKRLPEDRRNSPRESIEKHQISDMPNKEEDMLLKVVPERPELSKERKALKRRSTETRRLADTDGVSSSSDEDLIDRKSTNKCSTPVDASGTQNEDESEQMIETDAVSSRSLTTSEPNLSYNEIIEGGGVLAEIQNTQGSLSQGPLASLICKMVMIGSYNYVPQERIIISQDGVRFSAPLISDNTVIVPLQVKFEQILKLNVHFGEVLPLLVFYIRLSAAKELRHCLGMKDPHRLWYDPLSKDPTKVTIMIWPQKISEESEMVLKTLFSTNSVLAEMSIEEASLQLLRASPKSILQQMRNFVKNLGVETAKLEHVLAGTSETHHKKPQRLIKEFKLDTRMTENRENGMDSRTLFKKPKNWLKEVKEKSLILMKRVKENTPVEDDQEETDKFLLETNPSPKVLSTQNTRSLGNTNDKVNEMLQLFRPMYKDNTSIVEDGVEYRKCDKPVKNLPSLRKKSKQNTSTINGAINSEPEAEYQISIKKFDQNTSKIENTEKTKVETLSQKPISSLKRTRATPSTDANDISETQTVLVYPPPPAKGGITITVSDIRCLHEGQYLNDLIIDFYLKYLTLEVLSEADKKRTHIFSVHFYKRLTSSDGVTSANSTLLSSAARHHANVKNWTKHVNIFEKDFVVVPINEDSHWFLTIICFPGLVSKEEVHPIANNEDGIEKSSYRRRKAKERKLAALAKPERMRIKKRPCILIFDSLMLSESRYKSIMPALRDYLSCEHRSKMGSERIFSEETIRGGYPKVPQQSNFSDCGVYLLQYVESFFSNPIEDFELPIKTLRHWFDKNTIASKRQDVIKLIRTIRNREQLGDDVS